MTPSQKPDNLTVLERALLKEQTLSAIHMHVDSYNTKFSILFIQSKAWTLRPPLQMPIWGVKSPPTWYRMCQKCSHFKSSACGFVRQSGKPSHLNLKKICVKSRSLVGLTSFYNHRRYESKFESLNHVTRLHIGRACYKSAGRTWYGWFVIGETDMQV